MDERDLNTDFLLVLLARLLRVAPTLRVTLMSATLDAKLFADYFRHALHGQVPVPTLQISGRAFPVREVFLEDVVKNFNLVGCPEPRRRAKVRRPRSRHNGTPNAERDEDDPELSKQLLQQAARQSRVSALLGPHFEEERLSPHAIAAAVVTPLTIYKQAYAFSVAYGFCVAAMGGALLATFSPTGTALSLFASCWGVRKAEP